jgi:hypothetical protein
LKEPQPAFRKPFGQIETHADMIVVSCTIEKELNVVDVGINVRAPFTPYEFLFRHHPYDPVAVHDGIDLLIANIAGSIR